MSTAKLTALLACDEKGPGVELTGTYGYQALAPPENPRHGKNFPLVVAETAKAE